MKIKKIIGSLLLCAVFATESFAAVLGELTKTENIDFGAGASLYNNSFENGNTKQKEFYVEYEPNNESVPVVLNGEEIYGKRTILQAAKYYDDLNYRPLIGINADYFSFKTGIPMGHTISMGRLLTKDGTGQNAVGFNEKGEGFISWLEIQTRLIREDKSEMNLDCINKWCFSGADASYFLTDDFGKETKTDGQFKFIIFSKVSGDIKIGGEAEFLVEEKFDADINIKIPEDKYVLVMDRVTGKPDGLAFMDSLAIGETIKMKNEAVYDKELWNNAQNGLGSVGGRLIENGEVFSNFEKGSAPRTAVGVTKEGKIIFYVVDGRQAGYSTGLSLETLAKRMAELGCVDAINLDGGGSTAIAGVYPGSDTFEVINKPSDGALRSCANYIFLQDLRKPTGIAKTIVLNNEQNGNYLTGTKVNIDILSLWDTNNFKMENVPSEFELINGDGAKSKIDKNIVTLKGNGNSKVKITMKEAEYNLSMNVYDFPDDIVLSDGKGGEIGLIKLNVGEEYKTELNPIAFKADKALISDSSCFSFELDGNIGTISGNTFTANTEKEAEGKITVRAGDFEKSIKVKILNDNPFYDMKSHWANKAVNSLFKDGIVTGVEDGGKLYYNPDKVMTRIEFSSLISKYLNIDTKEYINEELNYSDKGNLAPWMEEYAKAMTALGIINGIDGEFRPNDSLTRAQAATIIGRITPEEENLEELGFLDSLDVPNWAYPHFSKLIKNKVINGYADNTLKPLRNVTRAEAATIIFNLKSSY